MAKSAYQPSSDALDARRDLSPPRRSRGCRAYNEGMVLSHLRHCRWAARVSFQSLQHRSGCIAVYAYRRQRDLRFRQFKQA